MTAIIRAITFSATNEECDSLFPVLMFAVVGLLLFNCPVLANGAPPFSEFETF
jgi:hypothetical protein